MYDVILVYRTFVMTRAVRKFCINCGDPFRGDAELCADCTPVGGNTSRLPPHLHRCLACSDPIPVAVDYCATCLAGREARGIQVRGRIEAAHATSGICAHCRRDVAWENVRRMDRRNSENVVEVIYFCPHCRSVLELANYIEEKGTGSRRT